MPAARKAKCIEIKHNLLCVIVRDRFCLQDSVVVNAAAFTTLGKQRKEGGVFYLMWGCFLSCVISVIRRISVDDIIVILIFRLVFISKLSTRIRGQR